MLPSTSTRVGDDVTSPGIAVAIAEKPYAPKRPRAPLTLPTVTQPVRTRRALNRIPLTIGIAVLLVLVVLVTPVKQRCGAPGYSCATALDSQGNVHFYFEVEPLGVYLTEIITRTDIHFCYKSGDESVKVR